MSYIGAPNPFLQTQISVTIELRINILILMPSGFREGW